MPVQALWDLLAELVTMHGYALTALECYSPQGGDYSLTPSATDIQFHPVWDPFLVNLNLNLRFSLVQFRLHELNLGSGSERFSSGGSRFEPVYYIIIFSIFFPNFFDFI
jgi:hypothetical protein